MLYLEDVLKQIKKRCRDINTWAIERTFTQMHDYRETAVIYYRKGVRQITMNCTTTYDLAECKTKIQRINLIYDIKTTDGKYHRLLDRDVYSDDYFWIIFPELVKGIIIVENNGTYNKIYLLAEGDVHYDCENFRILE